MKHIYIFCGLMLAAFATNAQTIYNENFDNGMPDDYVLVNIDGLTPDDPDLINLADSAWIVTNISAQGFGSGAGSNAAFSVSWYLNDEGPSDDWMILPPITLQSDPYLSWTGMAITSSGDFRDQYQVFVVTGGQNINDFILASPIFDTGQTGEETVETLHTISLSDYAGETVYIGFRNNTQPFDPDGPDGPGNGGNELAIDNITVTEGPLSVAEVDTQTLKIYPSLNDGNFQLELNDGWNGIVELSIMNMSGQIVYKDQVDANGLVQSVQTGLTSGQYVLMLEQNGVQKTETFVVR
ncbi:MAG: T9SS type A sorting domain-containing protein [Flavobacteriales bacterium]|nr:T9SS type A sorting domain-containing protein [Flavobacteriales bacterium]